MSLTELRGVSRAAIRHLTNAAPEDFSAMTVILGSERLIVYNPAHAKGRRSNSIAHELSHVLLEHEPHDALSYGGCRRWNPTMEEEADWLAGALLVPREAAVHIARSETPPRIAAGTYGVSITLMEWRLNHTGARVQALRERRTRTRL